MKWNASGFRPPLCTYRLNWARRTSWGWWDDWDDTVLQTQDSKFEAWRSEAEHATSRSRRLPTILTFTRGWGRNNFVSFKQFCFFQTAETGNRTPDSGVKGSGANHYPRAPARLSWIKLVWLRIVGSPRDRKVACSASNLQGLNLESCVYRAVSYHSPSSGGSPGPIYWNWNWLKILWGEKVKQFAWQCVVSLPNYIIMTAQ